MLHDELKCPTCGTEMILLDQFNYNILYHHWKECPNCNSELTIEYSDLEKTTISKITWKVGKPRYK